MSEEEDNSSSEEDVHHDVEQDFNKRSHATLLKSLSKMDGNIKASSQRREIAAMTEHHAPSSRDHVLLHKLVGALQSTKHRELKKQIQRVKQRDKVLPVPLCKPEQERVHRTLAYETVTEDISQWNSTILNNRKAEQLQFPLEQPDLRVLTSAEDLIKRTQPKTSLELEVAAMLGGSDSAVLDEETLLTPAEMKAMAAMSVAEARLRRHELQKYRALLSYKETKARRQNKIKSKKYHRILQKEKLKQEKRSLDEMERSDPDAFSDKLRKLDADRMQERISLKHRGGSKFARKQVIYKKYDDKARDAIQEMLHKSRELSKKVAVETDSSAAEESEDDGAPPSDINDTKPDGSSVNPWMTAGIRMTKKAKNTSYSRPTELKNADKVECEEETIEVTSTRQRVKEVADLMNNDRLQDTVESGRSGKKRAKKTLHGKHKELESVDKKDKESAGVNIDRLFDKLEGTKAIKTVREMKQMKKGRVEEEEDEEGEEEEEKEALRLRDDTLVAMVTGESQINMSLKRKHTMEDFERADSDGEKEEELTPPDIEENRPEPNNKPVEVKRAKTAAVKKPAGNKKALSLDPNRLITLGGSRFEVLLAEEENSEQEEEESQSLTIAQAFATDDVVGEFSSEKRSVIERDKPTDLNMVLPGWGDWGGEGVIVTKRKKRRFTLKAAPAPPRKDESLKNVIISEAKDRTIAKHQVSDIPFPYINSRQFENSIRQPIGKMWNPETAYKKLIKPKKVTRIGTVIAPMERSQMKEKVVEEPVHKKKKNFQNKKHHKK